MAHIMTFFNIPINVSPKKVNNRQNVTAHQITTDVKKVHPKFQENSFYAKTRSHQLSEKKSIQGFCSRTSRRMDICRNYNRNFFQKLPGKDIVISNQSGGYRNS